MRRVVPADRAKQEHCVRLILWGYGIYSIFRHPMFLDGRPLLDNPLDARYFLDRPGVLDRLLRAVQGSFNTLLLGDRGSGKTTALAQLALRLRKKERPMAFIDAGLAATPLAVIELVRAGLGRAPSLGEAWRSRLSAAFVPAAALSVDAQLLEAVRSLDPGAERPSEPIPVLLDGLLDVEIAFTLFGRLRDELWRLPLLWIVSGNLSHEGNLLAPPADAFFDAVIRLKPLTLDESEELLTLRLDGETLDLNGLVGVNAPTPRAVLAIARAAALDGRTAAEVAAEMSEREIRLQGLGRSAHMAFAELQALDRPVSASDADFLRNLGWTRPRATKILKELEGAGLVTSGVLRSDGAGHPKVVYRIVET